MGQSRRLLCLGVAAPSVPTVIGSKVTFGWVSKLCALYRPHLLTDFVQMSYGGVSWENLDAQCFWWCCPPVFRLLQGQRSLCNIHMCIYACVHDNFLISRWIDLKFGMEVYHGTIKTPIVFGVLFFLFFLIFVKYLLNIFLNFFNLF